ncbi:MAG: DUF1707 domain-containing protein [Acidimicrobiales bacterium]
MDNPDLRLSDGERERVASRLRDAVAELPAPVPPPPPRGFQVRRHVRRFVGSVGVLWGIWAVILVTGGGVQGWWPLWVTVPWAIATFA